MIYHGKLNAKCKQLHRPVCKFVKSVTQVCFDCVRFSMSRNGENKSKTMQTIKPRKYHLGLPKFFCTHFIESPYFCYLTYSLSLLDKQAVVTTLPITYTFCFLESTELRGTVLVPRQRSYTPQAESSLRYICFVSYTQRHKEKLTR